MSKGQVLPLLVVFMSCLILMAGLILRGSQTLLTHTQIQRHCDRKVLDALAWQAKGLEKIGELNPFARTLIKTRRQIDKLILANSTNPAALAPLLKFRQHLRSAQKIIEQTQSTLKAKALALSLQELGTPPPRVFGNRVHESFQPTKPSLHIRDEDGYQQEIGAPKILNNKPHEAHVLISVETEKFLVPWRPIRAAPAMKVSCSGKIRIVNLERTWQVNLADEARPL